MDAPTPPTEKMPEERHDPTALLLRWRHKVVRDLAWVLASPHLLSDGQRGLPVLGDWWCRDILAQSQTWLDGLDAQPSPLLGWLAGVRSVQRLGYYFAALLEYWVRFSPALVAVRVTGDTAPDGPSVLTEQQVHSGLSGAVAGQIKAVFRHRDGLVHLESHIKLFAYVPRAETGLPVGEDEGEAGLGRFVGPFLGENLLHRVIELRRKLGLTSAPGVQSFILGRFGMAPEDTGGEGGEGEGLAGDAARLVSRSALRGYLFYPLSAADGAAPPEAAASASSSSASSSAYLNKSTTSTGMQLSN